MGTAAENALGPRRRARRIFVFVTFWAVAVGLVELLFYGLSRVGVLAPFYWWRGPLQVLPMWIVLPLMERRQHRREVAEHLVRCAWRRRSASTPSSVSWHKGHVRLAPGMVTFVFDRSVVVPREDRPTEVATMSVREPPSGRRARFSSHVLVVIEGPEGEFDLRVDKSDVDRLRGEVMGSSTSEFSAD